MGRPSRIISLNLGSQTIGLAEFIVQPNGGLVLNAYRLREILGENMAESVRNARITQILRELLAELKVRSSPVNYAIAAQSVFARFVKLPAVAEEKVGQIIAFEAQQNVPFPIDEVIWDYQLVGGGGVDEQIQVVLVAIKSDLIEEINTAVEAGGLTTSVVDVASMALYNAFRYNYSDLSGGSLLVDIGARTTNLLFIEPGKIFTRSVSIGGGSITAAVAKEFGESIPAAEMRKKRDGFISLGGAYAEPSDPEIARLSKIMRSAMTRLHAEIMRSISHYRAQQQGSQPVRVFLCGGSASTPYMREFFQEKLQLPVEFFHPLRNVAVTDAVSSTGISTSAHLMGELVGLALRSTANCPMELTLRPRTVVAREQLSRRRPFFILAATCCVLGLLAWAAYYLRAAQVERRASEQLEERIETMKGIDAQLGQVRKKTSELDNTSAPLLAVITDRSFWPQIIDDLNKRLPKEDIWITELVATSAGKMLSLSGPAKDSEAPVAAPLSTAGRVPGTAGTPAEAAIDGLLVRGLYLSNPKQQEIVVDYFRMLVDSEFFVIDPNNQAKYLKPTTPNSADWAFPYELRLELKKPVKFP